HVAQFFLTIPRPPRSTPFPYTTLFRSNGLGEEAHEAQANVVRLLERLLVFFAQLHDGGHVHLVEGGEDGRGLLGADQALGDALADLAHRHLANAGGVEVDGHGLGRCSGGGWRRAGAGRGDGRRGGFGFGAGLLGGRRGWFVGDLGSGGEGGVAATAGDVAFPEEL